MDKPTPKTKVCNKCFKRKALSKFSLHPEGRFGVRPDCKMCVNKRIREKRHSPEFHAKHIADVREWQQKHRQLVRGYKSTWKKNNKPAVRRHAKKQAETLTDSYIALAIGLSVADIPPALIEAKRIQIQIKRYLKNGNQ